MYKQSESEQETRDQRGAKRHDRVKERETRLGWRMERDLLALKLFYLMVLRGIDGRKEGHKRA